MADYVADIIEKESGFTDIDKIKEQMLKELDNSNKQKNS